MLDGAICKACDKAWIISEFDDQTKTVCDCGSVGEWIFKKVFRRHKFSLFDSTTWSKYGQYDVIAVEG